MKIDQKDLKFEYFKRSNSKGGQKQNKTSSAVRLTHTPSGITIEASEERSQTANKDLALAKLIDRLEQINQERLAKQEAERYNSKDNASFASQIRTYRLCGNSQGVTDHRTGVTHPNSKKVLDGDLDIFLTKDKRENSHVDEAKN